MNKFEQYFLGITDEELRQHKSEVKRVRQNTNKMLKNEAIRLFKKGF